MNKIQLKAIQGAIGNAEDNLYRAKMQRNADPNWKTGNGETIDEYIAGLEKTLRELKAEL